MGRGEKGKGKKISLLQLGRSRALNSWQQKICHYEV